MRVRTWDQYKLLLEGRGDVGKFWEAVLALHYGYILDPDDKATIDGEHPSQNLIWLVQNPHQFTLAGENNTNSPSHISIKSTRSEEARIEMASFIKLLSPEYNEGIIIHHLKVKSGQEDKLEDEILYHTPPGKWNTSQDSILRGSFISDLYQLELITSGGEKIKKKFNG